MLNFTKATQEQLAEYCRRYLPKPEGFIFRYQPQFPVARLINSQTPKSHWLEWYQKYLTDEKEYFEKQTKAWLANPKAMGPIIVSSWAPGNSSGIPPFIFLVEDGNHRVASRSQTTRSFCQPF